VTTLKKGDAVYGYPTFGGGWAEYVAVKEFEVATKPKSLSFAEAAAVPLGALTAWQALVDVAKLHAGQTILIHGGSGGVGSFAVQIAKARGARVIATASTGNQDLLKQLGADLVIDYSKTKFEDVAKDVDVVLDTYCRQCAITMSCRQVARSAMPLAVSGEIVGASEASNRLSEAQRHIVNALMLTRGTYNASGDFATRVGLPLKSGVGGGIVAILPGVGALCAWSPGLDATGNSVAAGRAVEIFAQQTGSSVLRLSRKQEGDPVAYRSIGASVVVDASGIESAL